MIKGSWSNGTSCEGKTDDARWDTSISIPIHIAKDLEATTETKRE